MRLRSKIKLKEREREQGGGMIFKFHEFNIEKLGRIETDYAYIFLFFFNVFYLQFSPSSFGRSLRDSFVSPEADRNFH